MQLQKLKEDGIFSAAAAKMSTVIFKPWKAKIFGILGSYTYQGRGRKPIATFASAHAESS
jgi:hypothetical protein